MDDKAVLQIMEAIGSFGTRLDDMANRLDYLTEKKEAELAKDFEAFLPEFLPKEWVVSLKKELGEESLDAFIGWWKGQREEVNRQRAEEPLWSSYFACWTFHNPDEVEQLIQSARTSIADWEEYKKQAGKIDSVLKRQSGTSAFQLLTATKAI
jgi:hypothetical protein